MKIIDLFAGAGGFSTGFEKAGFETVLAIEFDLWASETFAHNHKNTKVLNEDITKVKELNKLGIKKSEIDGIIGGPPCQGFSLSGKRDSSDPRNSLFVEYVRFVEYFKPKFFVMENVPGLLSMKTKKGIFVKDIILEEFEKIGFKTSYKILDASEFLVPQKRKRVFFIGVRSDIDLDPNELYPKPNLKVKFSIDDAISDLPLIYSGEKGNNLPYISSIDNQYLKLVRNKKDVVLNHESMKHTQRIQNRFAVIKQGQSLKDVPVEHMQRERGNSEKVSGKIYAQNNMRPFSHKPSPTVAASFQGNFVHPHLNRNYTAREAARLQSFPDWYEFKGKRTTMSWEKHLSQYQQIGNAVPPLLANAIAKKIKSELEK